jgi:hypothetical protein
MSDKTPPHFLRRIFGAPEPIVPPSPDPVATGPVSVAAAEDFETDALRQLWQQLEAKRGERAMLSRADIDPGELKHVLSRVGLIEVHREPVVRYRIRLAGTNWRNDLGFEATGMWLDEWPHETQKRLLEESWGAAVDRRQAVRTRRHAVVDGITLFYEAMIVPLSSDGEVVTMLVTVSAPWREDVIPNRAIGTPRAL